MSPATILSSRAWARRTFGSGCLGDLRRTRRLVRVAEAMARRPNALLPAQLCSPAALKATYRLLGEADVTPEALLAPHWQQTKTAAGRRRLVLFLQDTTHADYTAHPKTTGLGPIGDGRGQGFLLHTVLAFAPSPRRVLGLANHQSLVRSATPLHTSKESSWRRQQRARESQVWPRAVAAVGAPPAGSQWVHVGDRGSDLFDLLEACRSYGCDFLIRAAQDRCVTDADQTRARLLTLARSWAGVEEKTLAIPARRGTPARETRVAISFGAVTVSPPAHPRGRPREPIPCVVVRVWEVTAATSDEEPIEWVLLTSVATRNCLEAWERVEWYRCRWLIEEYHHCLKSGCLLEARQLHDYTGLTRLLAVLAPLAVRLLQLREIAREAPERLAREQLPGELVALVAVLAGIPPEQLTVGHFWREVARQGGHLGRRRDGPPGWQTLWRGWLQIQTLLDGVRLAAHLPPPTCG